MVWLLKRKLYQYLRHNLTHHWVDAIQIIAKSLNSIPLKKLGFLTPNDINSEASSVLVDNALKKHNLPIPKDVTFQDQQKNQQKYVQSKNPLQKGVYVMLTSKETPFDKSFDLQVSFLLNL